MKSLKHWLPLALLFTLAASVALAGQWTGWILDKKCAEAGIHDGNHTQHISADNPAVFLNESDRKVFTLQDAGNLETLLGKRVVVEGDANRDTIRVTSMKEIAEAPLSSE